MLRTKLKCITRFDITVGAKMGKDRVPVLLNRAKGVNEEKGTNSSEADVLVLSIAGLAKKKEKGRGRRRITYLDFSLKHDLVPIK